MCSRCNMTRKQIDVVADAIDQYRKELHISIERDAEQRGWDCCESTEAHLLDLIVEAIHYVMPELGRREFGK